jgi:hypothetical protein
MDSILDFLSLSGNRAVPERDSGLLIICMIFHADGNAMVDGGVIQALKREGDEIDMGFLSE